MIEVRDHNKYVIKVHGSGRLSIRNRRFLRKLFEDKAMFTTPQRPPILPKPPSTPGTTIQPTYNSPSPFLLQVPPSENDLQQPPSPNTDMQDMIDESVNPSSSTPVIEEIELPTSQTEEVLWNPDRPVRNRQVRTVYDASTGTYIKPVE